MSLENTSRISGQQHWLKTYSLKVKTVAILAVLWPVFFLIVTSYEIDNYLDAKIADPINFRIRDMVGRSPVQEPNLKIFAIDDKAFAMLGTPMPSLDLWADVIDSIAERKPRLIVIDAMFSARPDELTPRSRTIFNRVKSSGVNVATGAFVVKDEIKYKTNLNRSGSQYKIDQYFSWSASKTNDVRFQKNNLPPWVDRSSWAAYGPSEILEDIFNHAGHFQLFDENKIEPFLWMGDKNIIPHLSMYAADSVDFREQKIIVNGHPVALDRHGATPVNFIPRSKLTILSMEGMIRDARDGYMAPNIKANDVVVILPLYFTGNVDLRPSPYGWQPGGHYLVAMINSVMSGKWLQPVLATEVLIVSMCVAGVFSAYLFSAVWFWGFWILTVAFLFCFTQAMFSFAGLVIPYVLPILAGTIAGANIFALKVRSYERKAMALRMALDGAVSPAQMDNMIRRPDQVNLEPRERVVTLMFIDVVGFSLSSENMLPRMAFDNLKAILNQIAEIIHAHGGVIDKTLGDGLLCYFGYRLDTDETDPHHPEKALSCAVKIQEHVLEESLRAMTSGDPIYPVRIGINTASCYLGDLGSGQRIEFTVVGNGVNFAKRLESACEMFAVMIGPTTFDLVKGVGFESQKFSRKMIKIKHHAELIDAYEVNPFDDRLADCDAVIEAFRRESNLQRKNDRMPVNDPESLIVTTQYGPAEIMNFSMSGVSIILKNSLSRGMIVEVELESRVPGLAASLTKLGMKVMESEVRWSYRTQSGVAHGLIFNRLSEEQQKEFIRLMTHYAFNTKPVGGGDDLEAIKAG